MKVTSRRAVAVAIASMLGFSASASGLEALGASASIWIGQMARRYPGHFTQIPLAVNLGPHPGRAPETRGGLWSAQALSNAQCNDTGLWACTSPACFTQGHTLAVAAAPGSTFPWEVGLMCNGGSLNTGNGDKLTKLHLLSWKCRGGLTLDFTLFHNSETNYSDELGAGWSWTYDIYINYGGNGAIVHFGDGECVPYTVPSHQPNTAVTCIPPTGIHDTLVLNADGSWTLTTKRQVTYAFNTAGFCNQIADRFGNAVSITLNAQNYATQITDPTGRTLTIGLDANNKFTGVTDTFGRQWSFTINSAGDLSAVTWPLLNGNTYTDAFAYSSHRIVTHTDRGGANWTAAYNSDGSLASESDPLNHTAAYAYTATATTATDPLSHVTTYNYSGGKIASVVDPCGFSVGYTWDANLNVSQIADQRGKHFQYTYDSNANILTASDPLSHTSTFTYSSLNDVLTAQDALGHTWTATRDSIGRIDAITDPLSHGINVGWGPSGMVTSISDPLNHSVMLSHGANGDVEAVTDPMSNTSNLCWDSLSHLLGVSDPLGHSVGLGYDNWDRPTTLINGDDSTVAVAYDAVGRLTSVTDENGHTRAYARDAAGRLTSVTNAKNEVQSYAYDNANRLISVTNGRGYARTYAYTNRGDVVSLTMPDGALEQWSYDGAGNCTAYTNALNQVIGYSFDDAGRLTGIAYPTGTNPTFSYDAANRQTQMTDATGTTSWTYDAANRLTGLNTPQGNMTYTYDAADREVSMTDSSGTTTYSYDADDNLTQLQNPFSEITSWQFDAASRIVQQTFASGAYAVYGYDSRDRATSITHKQSGGGVISAESYVYDPAGNLGSKTVDSVTTSYSYDAADQLTQESRTGYNCGYGYDANGNRSFKCLNGLIESYTYDAGDKLLSTVWENGSHKDYTYDAAGRTTSVTQNSQTTSYAYDYEDRITQITFPSGPSSAFTYNALDTRVGKVDSGGTKTYRRDGVDVTAPVLSDGVSAFTPGISLHNGGASKFLHGDRVGTFAHETDANQSTTATKQYDAFGNPTLSSGASVGPFGFAGGWGYQEDPDSGLKLLGHRYYDPSTGRFLTRDPTGDGRNWYTYCSNNPLRSVDPSGFSDEDGRPVVYIIIGSGLAEYGEPSVCPEDEELAWKYYWDLTSQGYDVHIVECPDDKRLDELIAGADGLVFIAHANGRENYIRIRGEGDDLRGTTNEWVDPARIKRVRHGRKLDFLILECCDMCTPGNLRAWLEVAEAVAGYLGHCHVPRRLKDPKHHPVWHGAPGRRPRIWTPGVLQEKR